MRNTPLECSQEWVDSFNEKDPAVSRKTLVDIG